MKRLLSLSLMVALLFSMSAAAVPSEYDYQRTVGPSQECCAVNSVPSSNSIEYFTYHRLPENNFAYQRAFFQPPRYSYGYAVAPINFGRFMQPARQYVIYKSGYDRVDDFASYKRSSVRETSFGW